MQRHAIGSFFTTTRSWVMNRISGESTECTASDDNVQNIQIPICKIQLPNNNLQFVLIQIHKRITNYNWIFLNDYYELYDK